MEKDEDGFWAEGCFVQSVSSSESVKKVKTLHKRHDEGMNFNCRVCKKKISAHNKDWHDGMCDSCFDETYFSKGPDVIEI